ncbi:MAG: winged helix-turn-helix transcriptional regulator, partial [Nanoarchaeota archaeon]
MIKLDLIDRKIICELDENCRQSLQRIARKLRISRAVVDYRIRRLEKEKVITNYIASINLGKFGYKTYKIYLEMHNLPDEEFIDFVRKSNPVLHAQKTEGGYDYSLAVATRSLGELDEFLSEMKTQFKELVKDFGVSMVIYTKIFKARKLLLGEKKILPKMEKYSGEEDKLELDDKDRAILKVLSQQANISLIELARRGGLSLEIVRYRLRQLSKTIIMSNRIIVNFGKLGYYHYV